MLNTLSSTMLHDEVQFAEMFLKLKAKAAAGTPWTKEEQTAINVCLEKDGILSVLAACCVLASGHPTGYRRSLAIVGAELGRERREPYVELSIYEALTHVKPHYLVPFYEAILAFIKQSLLKREVNLDNTMFLLGKLARAGETRAIALLQSLAKDPSDEVRDNASLVLRGLSPHQ
jgi:hypothetical protein